MFVDSCTRPWEAGGVCGLEGDQQCPGSLIGPVSAQRLIPECAIVLGILLRLFTMYVLQTSHYCVTGASSSNATYLFLNFV